MPDTLVSRGVLGMRMRDVCGEPWLEDLFSRLELEGVSYSLSCSCGCLVLLLVARGCGLVSWCLEWECWMAEAWEFVAYIVYCSSFHFFDSVPEDDRYDGVYFVGKRPHGVHGQQSYVSSERTDDLLVDIWRVFLFSTNT